MTGWGRMPFPKRSFGLVSSPLSRPVTPGEPQEFTHDGTRRLSAVLVRISVMGQTCTVRHV